MHCCYLTVPIFPLHLSRGEAEQRVKSMDSTQSSSGQQRSDDSSVVDKVASAAKGAQETVVGAYNKVADAVGDKVASMGDRRDTSKPSGGL